MAAQLNIGWGKRSLAPEFPVPIPGQFYMRVSLGTYTPVLASAVVLENGEDQVIFVSCDMVSVVPDLLLKVQALLAAEVPEIQGEKLIINATHTHAGPGSLDLGDYPRSVEMKEGEEVRIFLARQIADAVKEAWEKRAPGSIAYGYGFATTGHSRRVIYMDDIGQRLGLRPGIAIDGHGKMYGNTNDDMFASYEAGTDPFINLFYTFDKDEKLTGAVVNVPCPSQTGENAWVLHASFWHNVREKLAAKYGEIGVVGQAAAAGDLSPRQLHYRAAELRRYQLKYPEKIAEYMANPMIFPGYENLSPEDKKRACENSCIEYMRAEDIANRIVAAFDEVLEWASQEKFTAPELKHEVRVVDLQRRMFPREMMEEEKKNHENFMNEEMMLEGDKWDQLRHNSLLNSRRVRCGSVVKRYELQEEQPAIPSDIHVVKIGNIAFATNRFELYMDYMHRIQARSPFEQTFIVQLVTGPNGCGSYLATVRGEENKGYSASPYCNQVSPQGGQELVEETLKILKEIK
ncbi:MAG: hypothetical protein J6S54_00300 [Lentisphaeria bacterium]|nr:hypothetical protein [Lentisphaeria bacterium]